MATKNPPPRRYPPEIRERAVSMVNETIEQWGERCGVIRSLAGSSGSVTSRRQLGRPSGGRRRHPARRVGGGDV